MNYIEWCESVLTKLDAESDRNDYVRNHGIDSWRMENLVWDERYDEIKAGLKESKYRYVLDDAIFDFEKLGLIEDGVMQFHKLTLSGRTAAKNIPALWMEICKIGLPLKHQKVLETINCLSEKEDVEFARVEMIDEHDIRVALRDVDQAFASITDKDLAELLNDLRSRGLIFCERGEYPDEVRANYRGLVWQQKRDLVIESKEIDELVQVWETTSVDFKRTLYLDTAGERAEFIKDVIGLVNTQASGKRFLIVGFDNKTREFYVPQIPPERENWYETIDQDRIEQILSTYVVPNVEVRYKAINYNGGKVGRLEIMRDAKKLPYRVSKSLGDKKDKKRIEENQIFVRHGSHTVQPDEEELQDLRDEAARAKSRMI